MGWRSFAAMVVAQVTCVAVLIAAVFFTAGVRIERAVLRDQARFAAEYIASSLRMALPAVLMERLPRLPEQPAAALAAADARVQRRNRALMVKAAVAACVCCVAGAVAVLLLAGAEARGMLGELLATGLAVAAVEIAFAALFARQFLYLDPSHVALIALEEAAQP